MVIEHSAKPRGAAALYYSYAQKALHPAYFDFYGPADFDGPSRLGRPSFSCPLTDVRRLGRRADRGAVFFFPLSADSEIPRAKRDRRTLPTARRS